MLLRAAVVGTLALALAACGGSAKKSTQPQSKLPPGCSAAEVETIVTGFLARPTVAPPPLFRSYSTNESDGRTFTTASGPKAAAHARARLAAGEHDRLIQLGVRPVDINRVTIVFTLTRTAPDFAKRGIHTRLASGSGLVDCAHGKVAGWAIKGP